MKILLIGATHGNELLGVKVYERLLKTHSPLLEHVIFMVGNPRAYAQGKRFMEADLNRCYGVDDATYESKRARTISDEIQNKNPDIVIDIHTTTAVQPSCLIVNNLRGGAKRAFLRASHVSRVLKITSLSDICSLRTNIIGYEVSTSSIEHDEVDKIIADMQRYVEGRVYESAKLIYHAKGKIYANSVRKSDAMRFKNFEMSHLGYVPIMVGEDSYREQTDYIGFYASKEKHITV